MIRKVLAAILAAVMVFMLLPTTALAVVQAKGGIVSSAQELNAALGGVHIVSGNRVTLTQSVQLNKDSVDPTNLPGEIRIPSGNFELDLNSYYISGSQRCVFRISGAGESLAILDSDPGGKGKIINTGTATDTVVDLTDAGTLNMYGGELVGPSSNLGSCVNFLRSANMNYYGGTLTPGSGRTYAIYGDGTVKLIGTEGKTGIIKKDSGNFISSISTVVIDSGAYVTVDGSHVTSITSSAIGEVRVYRGNVSLSTASGSGGTVSPATSTVQAGSSPTVTLTPNAGYEVDKLFVNGVDRTSSLTGATSVKTLTLTIITENTNVIGTFKPTGGATGVIVQAGYGGTISTTSYAVTANAGYVIDQLWVDGAEVTAARGRGSYTPSPPTTSIFATFAYTVNFNQPANGSLTVARAGGNLTSGTIVRGGDQLTITSTPSANYTLSSLTVNGTAVTPTGNAYTYTVGTSPGAKRSVGTRSVMASGATIAATFAAASAPTAPVITTQPVNQVAMVGSAATFTVVATGNPAPSYRWQYSINNGASWQNATVGSGMTSASYTAPAATTVMHGYQYRCVVSNGTSPDATSSAAALSVTLPITIAPASTFLLGSAPGNLRVTVGAGTAITITDLVSATMDGVPLTDGNEFTGSTGSIIMDFAQSYLNTLAPGSHTLRVTITGGAYAEARIIVTAPGGIPSDGDADVPKAGDGSMPLLWAGLVLLAGCGLFALRRKRKA